MIRVWSIFVYGGMIGYDKSRSILVALEDKEMRSGALEKLYLLAGARANEAKREAEEFRSNFK